MRLLGIDIGGTTIKAGIVEGFSVKRKAVLPTPNSKEGILAALQELIHLYAPDKIGIGCPGIIVETKVLFCPNLPLKGFDFKTLGKVSVINDAAAYTLAEWTVRKTRSKDFVCLTLGTGVGSGLVVDGKLRCAELGHMSIDFKGLPSTCCGNSGCLESKLNVNLLKASKKECDQFGKHLGIGIANIINILHPECIILGGGKRKAFKKFENTMRREIRKRALFTCKIEPGLLDDAGIIGAALLTSLKNKRKN